MRENELQFFGKTIETIETEHSLWLKLHSQLEEILDAHGELNEESEEPFEEYRLKLANNWEIYISRGGRQMGRQVNRWKQDLTLPIEVELWWTDDGQPYDHSISDDSKLSLVCSPRGVVDNFTAEHLPLEQVQSLLEDIDRLRSGL
jgi:hypothetical protein